MGFNVLDTLSKLATESGFAGFFAAGGWQNLVMIVVACVLLYLGIVKGFEPLLLVGIAFGCLLANVSYFPGLDAINPDLNATNALYHPELWSQFLDSSSEYYHSYGHILSNAGLLDIFYIGVKAGLYPSLIFMGVGAMTDFGPLIADPKSLLIVVDTNRPDQVESRALLESIPRVAVIDHHRRAADYIEQVVLNLHEPFASSASELVTELLQYAVDQRDIRPIEAQSLLAGIVLDTKKFSVRTGSRTFEAAAFLRRAGADTVDVMKLFQNDLDATIVRYHIIQSARLYRNEIAIAAVDHTVPRTIAAQAADELLNISGIMTSFVLYPDGDVVFLSARSIGSCNVQVVLEKLGGGGNAATAGAQIKNKSVREVLTELVASIDQFYES